MSNAINKTAQTFIDATGKERNSILRGLSKDDQGELAHELANVINESDIRFHPYMRAAHKKIEQLKKQLKRKPDKVRLNQLTARMHEVYKALGDVKELLDVNRKRADSAERHVRSLQAREIVYQESVQALSSTRDKLTAELEAYNRGYAAVSQLYALEKSRANLLVELAQDGFLVVQSNHNENAED